MEGIQVVSPEGELEKVFGLTNSRCTEIEDEITGMIVEDINKSKTMSSTINHVISRYNELERVFASYTVGSMIGMMYNIAK